MNVIKKNLTQQKFGQIFNQSGGSNFCQSWLHIEWCITPFLYTFKELHTEITCWVALCRLKFLCIFEHGYPQDPVWAVQDYTYYPLDRG